MQTYETHDNGGRAYRVSITPRPDGYSHVVIRRIADGRSRPLFQLDSREVFIGESLPNDMTRFSAGHGPQFDGNSILIALAEENTYLHVGRTLITFRTKNPVMRYESPVGNSDVPYPWAVDSDGNYYLVVEGVILLRSGGLKEAVESNGKDPYDYYYDMALMSPNRGRRPPQLPVGGNYRNIDHLQVGNESYTLTYHPDPNKDYDRILSWGTGNMSVLFADGREQQMSRNSYLELLESFGRERGFEAMDIIEERE